jgi:hypothetical protein
LSQCAKGETMKKLAYLSIAALMLVTVSCKKDYRKAIVGEWNAGKATLQNDIRVTVRADGTITSRITKSEMKPLNGTWLIEGDNVTFKFTRLDLSYRILTLDDQVLVMKWKFAKITWHRIK